MGGLKLNVLLSSFDIGLKVLFFRLLKFIKQAGRQIILIYFTYFVQQICVIFFEDKILFQEATAVEFLSLIHI